MQEILTVTLNPAVDVFTSVESIAPGHKLRCLPERRDAGGGGINVARAVKSLGGEVLAAYPAGGPIGEFLQRLVEAEGVKSLVIPIAGDTRESFTVWEQETQSEYRFVLPGPTLSEEAFQSCLSAIAALGKSERIVVASGSLPPGLAHDAYARMATEARQAGAKFVLDASGPALKAALEVGVFLIKPNLRELRELVGAPLDNETSLIAAARQLVEQGRAQIVAISMSAKGALLVTKDQAWAAEAIPVPVSSTVGAGDSFLGAIVWALAAGHGPREAFRYALAAGAAALLTPGTQLCRMADVTNLLAQANPRAV